MLANVLGPEFLLDRLDLRNCVPLFGRMVEQWESSGIEVKRLDEIVKPTRNIINPSDYPQKLFALLKVSYQGRCEVESERLGERIVPNSMQVAESGQMVFSKIRATDGAVGIVPPELDGALVSRTSYTVFDCGSPKDTAYLWSVLRSHEIRADMQSLSPGSGRYTTYWPDVGRLLLPWLANHERHAIGECLIELWESERQLEILRKNSTTHLHQLGIESEESTTRWKVSKAPQ